MLRTDRADVGYLDWKQSGSKLKKGNDKGNRFLERKMGKQGVIYYAWSGHNLKELQQYMDGTDKGIAFDMGDMIDALKK